MVSPSYQLDEQLTYEPDHSAGNTLPYSDAGGTLNGPNRDVQIIQPPADESSIDTKGLAILSAFHFSS